MTAQAYPLQWPNGKSRQLKVLQKRARFSKKSFVNGSNYSRQVDISLTDAIKRVIEEVERIGGRGLVISSNLEVRLDGLPRSGQRKPDDCGVCIYFDLSGKPRAMPCDTYDTVEGNIAAVAAHIEATRQIERHGVATVSEMFAGFMALPAPTAGQRKKSWHEVLNVPHDAKRDHIEAAYREKAKKAHPDMGGSVEAMHELNEAKREALA